MAFGWYIGLAYTSISFHIWWHKRASTFGYWLSSDFYDIGAIIYFSLLSRLKQIVEMLSPLSISYKIISEFKSIVFIFQNADNHHNDYFFAPVFIIEILVESGPFRLYFEKYVAELDKLLPITLLVCLCNVYQLRT